MQYENNVDRIKFLTINTASLWRLGTEEISGKDPNLVYSEDGLSLRPIKTYALTRKFSVDLKNAEYLAFDRCNILYIIHQQDKEKDEEDDKKKNKKKKILVHDLTTGISEPVDHRDDDSITLSNPRSIAVDRFNVYVLGANSILIFAKVNFQLRRRIDNVGTDPKFIAIDKKGNIFVFDSPSNEAARIFKISADGTIATLFRDAESILKTVVAIALGQDGSIFVMDSDKILALDSNGRNKRLISLTGTKNQFIPSSLSISNDGDIFVSNKSNDEFPSPIRIADSTREELPYYSPSDQVFVDDAENVYLVNRNDNEIVKLQPIEKFATSATYVTKMLDSREHDREWHKVEIDAELPDNTSLLVSYFAFNYPTPKQDEDIKWRQLPPNPRDALLFEAKGRFIWFKLQLISNDNVHNPKVKSLKAYFPKHSYLNQLPAIFQEDKNSKAFLERFLSLFQTLVEGVDNEILSFTKYIDSKVAPEGFLPWLASWLALSYDEGWPTENVRTLIKEAPALYKMRGTRQGLERIILIYLGNTYQNVGPVVSLERRKENQAFSSPIEEKPIIIIESFQYDCVKDDENYAKIFCANPYTFCVLIHQSVDKSKINSIRRIVEDEKPAHTMGFVNQLQPWFYIGMHTYLGVNTCLNKQSFVLPQAVIGRDTVLSTEEESGQLDVRARTGIDTYLS
jgi:phage tail-like protein